MRYLTFLLILTGCEGMLPSEAPIKAQACIDRAYEDYSKCSTMVNEQISGCYLLTPEFVNHCDNELESKLKTCKEK